MLLSKLKYLFSLFGGKKKSGADFLKSEIQLQDLPGQSSYQNGRYKQGKNRITRFLQLLTGKKRANHNQYKRPVNKRKIIYKALGLFTILSSLLFFILVVASHVKQNSFRSLSYFQVSEIVFSGIDTISKEKLREASGIVLHQTSLIGLNCAQVEAGLITVPWVERAVVKRNWPSTVEISIVENVPVALLHSKNSNGAQLQYVDKQGVPFLEVRPGADIDYPVITGLTEIDEPIVRKRALAEVLIFLKKVSGNNPHLPAQSVSEIHLNRDGEMVVYLVEYPFPIFFGNSNTSQKYSRLVQVLKTLYKKQNGKGSISQVEYIQMDYLNDKVLVAQSESG